MNERGYLSEAETLFIIVEELEKKSYFKARKRPDVLSNIRNEKEGEDVRYRQGDIGYEMKRKLLE